MTNTRCDRCSQGTMPYVTRQGTIAMEGEKREKISVCVSCASFLLDHTTWQLGK